MEIQFWNQEKIAQLSSVEQSNWFDVYNHGLEVDRGYYLEHLSETKTIQIQGDIKQEYLKFFKKLIHDKKFEFYTILYNDEQKIVSLCRLMKRDHVYYISGLETHYNYRQQGYGKTVLLETIKHAFELGYESIHSVVRKWNQASIKTHLSVGFRISEDKGDNLVLSFANIHLIIIEKIEEFLDAKIDCYTILSEKNDGDDIQLDYEIKVHNHTYIAKLHSSNDVTTKEIFNAVKYNHNTNPQTPQQPKYLESKRYGFAHKYHIHSRDYWLWMEEVL